MSARTLALIGDSILDNAPYTGGEADSTAHLQRLLPDWSVSRVAQDGATTADIPTQLARLGNRPAVAVLSVGGNDAVEHLGLLESRTMLSSDLLDQLVTIADGFAGRYEAVAASVAEHAERTLLCTIYEVRLEPAHVARHARAPLSLLNDRIIQVGSRLGLDVLDLRTVCTEPTDFVLQIEPSARGALKIASAIARVLDDEPGVPCARVFAA